MFCPFTSPNGCCVCVGKSLPDKLVYLEEVATDKEGDVRKVVALIKEAAKESMREASTPQSAADLPSTSNQSQQVMSELENLLEDKDIKGAKGFEFCLIEPFARAVMEGIALG